MSWVGGLGSRVSECHPLLTQISICYNSHGGHAVDSVDSWETVIHGFAALTLGCRLRKARTLVWCHTAGSVGMGLQPWLSSSRLVYTQLCAPPQLPLPLPSRGASCRAEVCLRVPVHTWLGLGTSQGLWTLQGQGHQPATALGPGSGEAMYHQVFLSRTEQQQKGPSGGLHGSSLPPFPHLDHSLLRLLPS